MGFKKDRAVNLLEEITETVKEVLPEVKEETPENTEVVKETPEVISEAAPKAEVKKTTSKKKKNYTKPRVDCGLKGTTIEVRDFKAICKKKDIQINIVLNGLLAAWNHENYCL